MAVVHHVCDMMVCPLGGKHPPSLAGQKEKRSEGLFSLFSALILMVKEASWHLQAQLNVVALLRLLVSSMVVFKANSTNPR